MRSAFIDELIGNLDHRGAKLLVKDTRPFGVQVSEEGGLRKKPLDDALHFINYPLTESKIASFVERYPRIARFPFLADLSKFNGCSLFSDALVVNGIRTEYEETLGSFVPYDLWVEDYENEDLANLYDAFVIGGSSLKEVELLYLQNTTGEIISVVQDSKQIVSKWADLREFFAAECKRFHEETHIS